MLPQPRKDLIDLPEVAHGALDFGELEQHGLHPEQVIDFSTNANAYGPPPGVREAVIAAASGLALEAYPDRQALGLRRALAAHLHTTIEHILPGNGTAELIQLVALAYLEAGDRAMVIGPTFGEYARFARLARAQVDEWHTHPEDNFAIDSQAIANQLDHRPYRIVFLCNPNNPTGQALPATIMTDLAAGNPKTLFVVDEAYLAFAGQAVSSVAGMAPNLLVLRSMTKDYALAGLRLGYALGHAQVLAALRKIQPPWSVNGPAQAAGVAALAHSYYLQATLPRLRAEALRLQAALQALGYASVPGVVHFFLIQTRANSQQPDGASLRSALRRCGLLVRDTTSFGLPDYVRIAARRPEENDRLIRTFEDIDQ